MKEKEKIKIEIIEELKELKRRITEVQSIKEGAEASGITSGNYLEKLKMQKQILQEMHDGIISAGSDGYITGWNKSAESITGYKLEDVLGKHFSIFYDKKDIDFLENYIGSGEKNICKLKAEMKKKSGEKFYSNLSVSSIKDSQGSPEGIICYFSDISEYKKIEESVEKEEVGEKKLSEELEKLQEEMKQEKELSEELKKELSGEVEKLHEKVKKEKEQSRELKRELAEHMEKLVEQEKKEKELLEEAKKELQEQMAKVLQERKREKEKYEELKKELEEKIGKLEEKIKKDKELWEESKKELVTDIEKSATEKRKEKEKYEEIKKELQREIEELQEKVKKSEKHSEELKKELEEQVEKLGAEIKKEKDLSEELKKDLSSGVEKLYEELNKEKELIAALKKEKELTAELKTTITAERKNFHEEMEKEIGLLAALNNTVTEEREKFQKELKEEKNLRVEMEKLNEKLKKDLTEEMDKLYEEIKKEKELTENMEKVLEQVKKEREFTEEQKKALEEMKKEIKQRKRSQKTLQENKFTLEMAQKISRLGYWSYNIQNNMYEWSDEMFHILGCSTEGGVPSYEDCKKIIHKDDWQRFDRAFKEAVNTGKSYNMDLKIIFPDMSIHYVNARACPQYDKDNNKITALFGVMQDITERKFLEEELKKSLDKLNIKNQIAGLFLTVSGENISWKILPAIMKSLKSIYGIFGLIDNNGNLVKTAGYIDRDHNIQISDGIIIKREGWSEGLKEILHEGKTCFSNTPASEGEIQIHRSLSVPLFRSGKPSGVLTVANKEEDYNEEDKILLQTIAEIVSPVLNARLESNRLKAELNGLEYQIKKAQKVESDLIQNILLK